MILRTSGTCRRDEVQPGECFYYEDMPEHRIIQCESDKDMPSDLPNPRNGIVWMWSWSPSRTWHGKETVHLIMHYRITNACSEVPLPPVPQAKDNPFPHTCLRCGASAYIGLFLTDCSARCSV